MKLEEKKESEITNVGRHSFAFFLSTEKPPWVLMSEAVKTLQKEWILAFGGSSMHLWRPVGSLCYSLLQKKQKKIVTKGYKL